jgi:hypothetical protein
VTEEKKKVLVLSDYYLPGFRAGGGLRTIVNMVDRLSERYDFWIVTRDHDSRLDKTPYKIVNINEWNTVGRAHVFYFSQDEQLFCNACQFLFIPALARQIKDNRDNGAVRRIDHGRDAVQND